MTRSHAENEARIDAQAADWIVRRSDGPLTAEEERALADWLSADTRHVRTWQAMHRTWSEAGELKHLAGLAELPPQERRTDGRLRPPGRRTIAGLATAAAAALAFALIAPVLSVQSGPPQRTGLGETRIVRLADGSTVTLGARSTIHIRFTSGERRVRLEGGQAQFDVRHDASRPFVVEAGATVVRDIGTRFDVNRTANSVRVSVIEGAVEVREGRGGMFKRARLVGVLRAGDRAEAIRRSGAADPQVVIRTAVAAPADGWRAGRLDYDNSALADVAADINRYYAPGVTLTPDAAGMRVTASFRTNEIPAFLAALGSVLPVTVSREADGGSRISRR